MARRRLLWRLQHVAAWLRWRGCCGVGGVVGSGECGVGDGGGGDGGGGGGGGGGGEVARAVAMGMAMGMGGGGGSDANSARLSELAHSSAT